MGLGLAGECHVSYGPLHCIITYYTALYYTILRRYETAKPLNQKTRVQRNFVSDKWNNIINFNNAS